MPGLTFTRQESVERLRKATERQRQERLDWADQEDRLGLMLERMAEEEVELAAVEAVPENRDRLPGRQIPNGRRPSK